MQWVIPVMNRSDVKVRCGGVRGWRPCTPDFATQWTMTPQDWSALKKTTNENAKDPSAAMQAGRGLHFHA